MKSLDFSIPISPLQEIRSSAFADRDVRFFIKRDDLLHTYISGNKWRKLKYNLLEAKRLGHTHLLTFGGAYSNHLAATAAAGKEFGFSTLGIVRGEKVKPLNPTLKYVEECGMELIYVSRTKFRNKNGNSIFDDLKINNNLFYTIPEGGSNCLALKGVAEMVTEINHQLGGLPDHICTACGTGATMAGIVNGMEGHGKAVGFSVLKGDFMEKEVNGFLEKCGTEEADNWHIENGYHFGGYAKFKPELIDFINDFKKIYKVALDPIYTGKMAVGVFELLVKGIFKKGETVVMVHTGGLQGVNGFNERFGGILE